MLCPLPLPPLHSHSHQAPGSICAKRCRVIQNRKKRQHGWKRSRFYPASSPKAVARRKAFFAFG